MLVRPEGPGRLPGVILLTDIGGIRPVFRETARRLAGQGYVVLLPNVFYRTTRPPVLAFPLNLQDEATRNRMGEVTTPLTPEAVAKDAAACVAFLASHPAVLDEEMGVVGYCFTGALALRFAAAEPDRIAAAASFHGGRLFTDAPASPHLVLPRVKARLYFAHATEDRSMPKEAITGLENALAAWGGRFESEVYAGVRHGWTVADSAAYDETQGDRAFAKLLHVLADMLA